MKKMAQNSQQIHHLPQRLGRFRFGSAQGGKKNVQTRNKSSQSAGKSTASQLEGDEKNRATWLFRGFVGDEWIVWICFVGVFFYQKYDSKSLGGGFKHVLFSPLIGEMIQFDEHIFFKWVGSTTN